MHAVEERPVMEKAGSSRRILVCIASYGRANDTYLTTLIAAYRGLPYVTHIVVLSNVSKYLGNDVEVLVGLPTRNPWSLPFGHKRIFAERSNDYDLFVYSEDDTLITRDNIEAFLRVSAVLRDDEVAGFFRYEKDASGKTFFPEVHGPYHWDTRSVISRGAFTFAFFTNEHAACYMLSREQLRRAIDSGGFLVEPHQGKYDLIVSAGTDAYTSCGFRKVICISHFTDFLVHHLPNKYIGTLSLSEEELHRQIDELYRIADASEKPAALLADHPEFRACDFGKDYYEPVDTEVMSLVPHNAHNILSIGCGWGATEEELVRRGKTVSAVPLDAAISACAEARGVETVKGDLKQALAKLDGKRFDCIIASNLFHLVDDPASTVALLAAFLSANGKLVASVPNVFRIPTLWRKLRRVSSHRGLGTFSKSGVHWASQWTMRRWVQTGGLRVQRVIHVMPQRHNRTWRLLRAVRPILASKIITVASRD